MDGLTVAATAGFRSRMESLSLLANNLANAATSGYKSDQEFYSLFTSEDAEGGDRGLATVPTIERQWTDFSQGNIQPTGNPLDVAISGRGFLTVNGPTGPLYTRNGNMRLTPAGELAVGDGFTVRSTKGTPIKVSSGHPIEISTDGTVRQDGVVLGQISIVDFKSTTSLRKASGTCFDNVDPKNLPIAAADSQAIQGRLEGSNVVVPDAAMRLVGVMRQFEMLQKAVTMGVDMNAKAIQEVARVGP
jgi:flagellar basal-body rod protein FlgF